MPTTDGSPASHTARVLAVLGAGVVDPDSPVLRADDAAPTRGDGCFEGCRLRRDKDGVNAVDKLDAHLARMTRSAAALDIPFDEPAWRDLIAQAAATWTSSEEASVKLLLSRGTPAGGPTGFVWIAPVSEESLRRRATGLRVVTLARGLDSAAFADAAWLLGGVKSLSYAVNMAALREAERRGADDVIFLSSDGLVLEAPTASVVWSVGRTLLTTPTGATGILGGTTQRVLFEHAAAAGWATEQRLVTLDELQVADVIWLVSSVRGPVDVVELDGKLRPRRPDVDAEIRALCSF